MVHVWYSRSIIFLELIILHIIKNEGNVNCYDWYNLFLKKKKKNYWYNLVCKYIIWMTTKKKNDWYNYKVFSIFSIACIINFSFVFCFSLNAPNEKNFRLLQLGIKYVEQNY